MFRALRELPSIIADYTVGTVIVFVQLTIRRSHKRATAA
jgi:hypothetical protein